MFKKRDLLRFLEGEWSRFNEPQVGLEQYSTPIGIVGSMFHDYCLQHGTLDGARVLDLGCGPGILLAASFFCGASKLVGIDIDKAALDQCASFFKLLEESVRLVLNYDNEQKEEPEEDEEIEADCTLYKGNIISMFELPKSVSQKTKSEIVYTKHQTYDYSQKFDMVVTNPPFGTRNQGIDAIFLQIAINQICPIKGGVVLSFHKSSTTKYLIKKFSSKTIKITVFRKRIKWRLKQTYKFHKVKKGLHIDVDLLMTQVHSKSNKDEI